MKVASASWGLLSWNLGCATLFLGLASIALSCDAPSHVSALSLREKVAGKGPPGPNAEVNVQNPALNTCASCSNSPPNSIGCVDVSHMLIGGTHTIVPLRKASCAPMATYVGLGCPGNATIIPNSVCPTTKTTYWDP